MIVIHYIRTLIAGIFVLLFLSVFSLFALPIVWLIGKNDRVKREKAARAIIDRALHFLCFTLGIKSKLVGKENLPSEPCLIVGNHRSFFDVITLFPHMHGIRIGFVGKKEFGKVFTFKLWLLYCGCFLLDRDDPRAGLRTINDAINALSGGANIVIYPEGTRNHNDELLPFHEGSFRIAEKSRCPIVPLVHIHTDDAFEKHFPYATPRKDLVNIIGEPIITKELDRQGFKDACQKCISEIDRIYKENV